MRCIWVLSILISLVVSSVVDASPLEYFFSGIKTDSLSSSIFDDLFSVHFSDSGITSLGNSVVITLLKWFNYGLLLISGFMVGYVAIIGTIYTANQGRVLGQKISNAWVVVRSGLSLGLMVPITSTGLSGIQVIMLWIIFQGTYVADHIVGVVAKSNPNELISQMDYQFGGDTSHMGANANLTRSLMAKDTIEDIMSKVGNQVVSIFHHLYCHELVNNELKKKNLSPLKPKVDFSAQDQKWTITFANGQTDEHAFFPSHQEKYSDIVSDMSKESFDCGSVTIDFPKSQKNEIGQLILKQSVYQQIYQTAQTLLKDINALGLDTKYKKDSKKVIDVDATIKELNKEQYQIPLDQIRQGVVLSIAELIKTLALYFKDLDWQKKDKLAIDDSWLMAAVTLQTLGGGEDSAKSMIDEIAKHSAIVQEKAIQLKKNNMQGDSKDTVGWISETRKKIQAWQTLTSAPEWSNLLALKPLTKHSATSAGGAYDLSAIKAKNEQAIKNNEFLKTITFNLIHFADPKLEDLAKQGQDVDTSAEWRNKTQHLRSFLADSQIYRNNLPERHLQSYEERGKSSPSLSLDQVMQEPGTMYNHVTRLFGVTGFGLTPSKDVKIISTQDRDDKTTKMSSMWSGMNPFELDNALEIFLPQGYASLYDRDVGTFAFSTAKLWLDTFVVAPEQLIMSPIKTLSSFGSELYRNAFTYYMNATFDVLFSGSSIAIANITRNTPKLLIAGALKGTGDTLMSFYQGFYTLSQSLYYNAQFATIKLIPLFGALIAVVLAAVLAVVGLVLKGVAAALSPVLMAIRLLLDLAFVKQFYNLSIISAVAMPLFSLGAYFAFFIPLMPVLYYFFGILGWLLSIIEAVVSAPFILLGMANPVGHDLLGRAQMAMMMLVSVFIRPITIVFGLIFSLMLISVSMYLLTTLFIPVINLLIDPLMDGNTLGNGIVVGLMMLMYLYIMVRIISMSLSLIFRLPAYVNRWIGLPIEESLQEDAEMVSDRMLGGFSGVGSAGGQMTQGGQSTASGTRGIGYDMAR